MFKAKLALFLACITLSFNACAGWVQYTFENTTVNDGGTVQGYFIQDLDDRSIAFYNFQIVGGNPGMINMMPSYMFNNILSASIDVPGGPTSFTVFDDLAGSYHHVASLTFGATSLPGRFSLTGWRTQIPIVDEPELFRGEFLIEGFVVQSAVLDPLLLGALEGAAGEGGLIGGLTRIVPTPVQVPVPEPGSLALLCMAGLGLLGTARRGRKPA